MISCTDLVVEVYSVLSTVSFLSSANPLIMDRCREYSQEFEIKLLYKTNQSLTKCQRKAEMPSCRTLFGDLWLYQRVPFSECAHCAGL